jgi:hypothetical protein
LPQLDKEWELMKAKEFIPVSKPRNFVAKNAQSSGAGRHQDSSKKKDQEQGKVKHKKDLVPMEGFTQAHADKNKIKNQKSGAIGHGLGWKNYGDDYKTLVRDIVNKFDNITRLAQYSDASESTKYKIVERFFKKYGYPFELFNDVITAIEKRAAGETSRYRKSGMEEGWSDAMVARRTGQPRTPYSVYIKGKKWKDFENDDHAEAVANKLKAKFKADGRDPSVITIAPTEIITGEASALEKFRKAADEREKKHDAAEKEMKARHARGEEDMKGSIDRLEKHMNNK